jgi:hypothetical protein
MGKKRHAYIVLVGKSEGRPSADNIIIDVKEIGWKSMELKCLEWLTNYYVAS